MRETHPDGVAIERKVGDAEGQDTNFFHHAIHCFAVRGHQAGHASVFIENFHTVVLGGHFPHGFKNVGSAVEKFDGAFLVSGVPFAEGLPISFSDTTVNVFLAAEDKFWIMRQSGMFQSFEGEPELTPGVNGPCCTLLAKSAQGRGQGCGGAGLGLMADERSIEIRTQQTNGHGVQIAENHTGSPMKSAYELAMERLAAKEPVVELTDDQKQRLADLESKCKADIAVKELLLRGEMEKARAAGESDQILMLQRQLSDEVRRFEEIRDRKKGVIRAEGRAE